jgi:DNA-nicking Smr family endonuclease
MIYFPQNPSEDEAKQIRYLERYGVPNSAKLPEPEKPQYHRKRIKKGPKRKQLQQEADFELDLHGYSVAEALVELDLILEMMHKHCYQLLRIIHGGRIGSYGPIYKAIKRHLHTKYKNQCLLVPDQRNEGSCLLRMLSEL